jgi:hypothetical protein
MTLNLIRLFDFYLALMFVLSLYRRWPVYADVIGLVWQFVRHGRWPRLLNRFNEHRGELLKAGLIGPTTLAVALMAAQFIASRLIFPQATITLAELAENPWARASVLLAVVPMLAVDLYFIIRVGRFDHAETIASFEEAEKWAGTYRARFVRTVTFGRVNPDRMVDEQVKDGLRALGATIVWAMWWVSVQVVLRLTFGLTLWTMWALLGR